jgi:predicted HicB family RNase H-like nuclease
MTYKTYEAIVEFDEDAGLFTGEVINTRDVITFQGESVEELKQAFVDSVEDYLEFCASRNEEPDKPFSGNFVVRMPPALHRYLAVRARREGKSLNSFVVERLEHSDPETAPVR